MGVLCARGGGVHPSDSGGLMSNHPFPPSRSPLHDVDARRPPPSVAARGLAARWWGAFFAGLFVLCAVWAPSQALAQSRSWRAKIDRVETRDAPEIKLFVTFLDDEHWPVNPDYVDLAEVTIDGNLIASRDVERTVWAQEEGGTDLVLVLPATKRLGETAFKGLQEAVPDIMKGLAETDRAGLVAYSRSVEVMAPLSAEKNAGDAYGKATRTGVRPFMFSALDQAITMLQQSPEGRKKAIIFVGDGTDAATIQVSQINEKCKELVTRARKAGVQIWTIGYATGGLNPSDTRAMRLMSRKTGATYRQAGSLRELRPALDQTVGEIVGQLVLTVKPDVDENQTYEFGVKIQSERGPEVETLPYTANVEKVAINWILWGIVCGVCCILTVIILVLLIYILRTIAKSRARREAEELLADLLSDREENCEVCHRVLRPEWNECPFCAQGMKPLDVQEREPPFVYDDQDRRLCNTCGRTCAMEWKACAFCAQGMVPLPEWQKKKDREAMLLGRVDPEKMTEMMMKQQEEEQAKLVAAQVAAAETESARASAMAQGGKECPTCGRIMPPHWPECLFCASGLPPVK